MTMSRKIPGIPENLPEGMAPIAVEGMPGVVAWFSFSATRQACEAAGHVVAAGMLTALLRGEPRAIEEAVPRALLNSDGSRWQAGPDAVPLPTLELGRLLADALHRRLFGEPLKIEGGTNE